MIYKNGVYVPPLDDVPVNGELGKAPTSNSAFDHNALTTGVHGAGASTVASVANIATHAALATGIHGVGASTVASVADIATHAALATGTHGVGASTVASVADIVTHAALTTGVHGAGASTVATVANIATHAADVDAHVSGASAGQLLVALTAITAAWQSTGIKLSAPDISGVVTALASLTMPAHTSGAITNNAQPAIYKNVDNSYLEIRGGTDVNGAVIDMYGKTAAGYPGAVIIYTPNAALAQTGRLILPGGVDTAIAAFINCTVTAPSFTGGDFIFKNGWRLTEAEDLGLGHLPGIALVRPDGSIAQVFN